VAAEILGRHPRSTEERLARAHENAANHNWRYPMASKKDKPYDVEQAVNDYINETNPRKDVPVPADHGCTGDTCWCKHF
jgi:hypothetical protein